jgi:hypothetical protein
VRFQAAEITIRQGLDRFEFAAAQSDLRRQMPRSFLLVLVGGRAR